MQHQPVQGLGRLNQGGGAAGLNFHKVNMGKVALKNTPKAHQPGQPHMAAL
jgi:hypothetical protein